MIKQNSGPYNIDSNSDSFCAHQVMVVPILRHSCAHTTHHMITVVLMLQAILFDCIHRIENRMGLIIVNTYSKTNFKKHTW